MSPKSRTSGPELIPYNNSYPIMNTPEEDLTPNSIPDPPESNEPFTTIAQDILPRQLDCIAWNRKYDLFSFGSYEIDSEDSGRRIGKLYIAFLSPEVPSGYTIQQSIENLPGILDLKWEPGEEKKLAIATSEGVLIYELNSIECVFLVKTHAALSKDMALYIEWMNGTDVIYSDAAGRVSIWNTTTDPPDPSPLLNDDEHKNSTSESGSSEEESSSPVKSSCIFNYYAWFVHYDPKGELIYSGDDSGMLRAFPKDHLKSPRLHYKKQFDTGVTSISTKDDIVAVGCYDEKLRIFTRTIGEFDSKVRLSAPLLEIELLGTVWRTLWLPPLGNEAEEDANVYKMGIAAGRNGVHMITFNRQDWSWHETLCCLDHKGDLAYGLDIKPNPADDSYTVATCYFDSHCLQIFKMKP